MCGFTGFLVKDRVGKFSESAQSVVGRMASALRHRGPDDSGIWCEGPVALAHRRLSILDLSQAGHQPMLSISERYVITYNGEIYNHNDIRKDLETETGAISWRGHSDTEVMLVAFERWGMRRALERFVGMFAFALWDRKEHRLILARDRVGEKPLYYGWMEGTFLFGSELKALREHPHWKPEINRDALSLFLRHNCIPAPYSIYRGIMKLQPGTFLTLSQGIREPHIEAYWSAKQVAEMGQASPFGGTAADAVVQLEALLERAIAGQMVADVPIGAFLSGGVDSSTVVALMQAQSRRPVRTFSIGFHEAEFNEANHASAVAKHLGTDHTELVVTSREAMDVIPLLPHIYDEPFADSSQIPTYLVAKLARQQVTVSLSGDGGDELFCGYNRYALAAGLWRYMGNLPVYLRNGAINAIRAFSPNGWNRLLRPVLSILPNRVRHANPGDRLHKLSDVLRVSNMEELYRSLVSHWQDPEHLVYGGAEPATILSDPSGRAIGLGNVRQMMYMDLVSYLPDDNLVKVDRAGMAVSLESRIPMLDHQVIEFASTLPLSILRRDGQSKWPLRQILYRHVPRALIERPKMGFGVPIDSWLRGPLRAWSEELLGESRLKREGFFNPAPIRLKWKEHLSGQRNWQYLLWDILMFQAWLEVQNT